LEIADDLEAHDRPKGDAVPDEEIVVWRDLYKTCFKDFDKRPAAKLIKGAIGSSRSTETIRKKI